MKRKQGESKGAKGSEQEVEGLVRTLGPCWSLNAGRDRKRNEG